MSKVTTKLQVTVPKAIADRYRIAPGDEIEWEAAGEVIRVLPPHAKVSPPPDISTLLRLFDEGADRQKRRNQRFSGGETKDRGWKREDLYDRGLAD